MNFLSPKHCWRCQPAEPKKILTMLITSRGFIEVCSRWFMSAGSSGLSKRNVHIHCVAGSAILGTCSLHVVTGLV